MPVIRYVRQDPTDTVLQGEQMRISGSDARENYPGNVVFSGCQSCLPSVVQDEDAFFPMNSMIEGNRLSIRRQKDGSLQVRANAGIATPCGAWIAIDYQPLIISNPGGFERLSLSGVSRDDTGAALGSCTVKVFLTPSDSKFAELTSDGSGDWSIPDLGATIGPFYLVEYKAGSPDRAGTSVNTLAPTKTN